MKKKKAAQQRDLPKPGKQYLGVHGKIVDWAEHVFEEGMLYVRVRFMEVAKIGDDSSRRNLAKLMANLSQGWFLASNKVSLFAGATHGHCESIRQIV
jgi:hypothetical protein